MFSNRVVGDHISVALIGSLFSRLIGSNIHHSIYLSQSLEVVREARVGESLVCQIEVKEDLGKNRFKLSTSVECQGEVVVQG